MFADKEATEIHGLLLVLQDCDSDAAASADESTNESAGARCCFWFSKGSIVPGAVAGSAGAAGSASFASGSAAVGSL